MKCKCRNKCSRELEILNCLEEKDMLKLTIHDGNGLFHTKKEIFVSKKMMRDAIGGLSE